MDKVCGVESCNREVYSKSICHKHYVSYNRGKLLTLKNSQSIQKKLELCSIDGCKNVSPHNGICIAHKTRMERHGTPDLAEIEAKHADDRFWSKVDKTSSCWNWSASADTTGHGRFFYKGTGIKAHHYAYMREYAEIVQEGWKLSHSCNNDLCVRPDHLALGENTETEENPKASRSDSKSKVRGVSLHKPSGKWIGNVGHGGKVHYVGLFDDIDDAERAVVAKRRELSQSGILLCTCKEVVGIHERTSRCTKRDTRKRDYGPPHPCLNTSCSKETTNPKYCSSQCTSQGRIGTGVADLDDWIKGQVSISDSEGRLTQAVKNHLLREANYSCTRCGWNKPNPKIGKPVLCIDHIDGNWRNNFKNNLVVLCYNCHSLTTTFGGLNRGSTVSPRSVFSRKQWVNTLSDGVEIDMINKGEL